MLAPANCCSVARTLPLRTPCENVSELLGPSPDELNSTIRHCAPAAVQALYAAPMLCVALALLGLLSLSATYSASCTSLFGDWEMILN